MDKTCRHLSTLTLVAMIGLSGCASYRVSSNVPDAPPAPTVPVTSAPAQTSAAQIVLAEDDLSGRRYTAVGPIEVSVKKLTIFHADPTKEQANEALREKARQLGATAVIRVQYRSGIGFTTWGYMDASGLAVKLLD